jgi:hypothetical protein
MATKGLRLIHLPKPTIIKPCSKHKKPLKRYEKSVGSLMKDKIFQELGWTLVYK